MNWAPMWVGIVISMSNGIFALVVGEQDLSIDIHLAGVVLGLDLDAAVVEDPAQGLGGDGLGEGSVERCDVGQFDVVSDALLGEERLCEEGDLRAAPRGI